VNAANPSPVQAIVAFARLAGLEALGVSEQARAKEALEARARTAIAGLPLAERVVLDADDGLAVVLFTSPVRALGVAEKLRRGEGFDIQVGLNLGPLALSTRGPEARVFGDGVSAAAAAARFATPDRLFLTVAFARALEATAPERAADLEHAGEYTDTRVRLHAFYTPVAALGVARRRRRAMFTAGIVLAIVLSGALVRQVRVNFFQTAPATVRFDVKPRGEVWIDGVLKGRIPPLTEVGLTPGLHRIQVRSAGFPPMQTEVDLEPGESITLTHVFGGSGRRDKAPEGFWSGLKRKLGL